MSAITLAELSLIAAYPGHRRLGKQFMAKIQGLDEGSSELKQIQPVLVKINEDKSHTHVTVHILRYDANIFSARPKRMKR